MLLLSAITDNCHDPHDRAYRPALLCVAERGACAWPLPNSLAKTKRLAALVS